MVDLLAQLFSSYADVHTFQLGVLLGLFVALAYRDHKGIAYALLFFGVFLAFGNAAHIGWAGISRKPWYFLGGVYITTVLGMILVPVFGRIRERIARKQPPTTNTN